MTCEDVVCEQGREQVALECNDRGQEGEAEI